MTNGKVRIYPKRKAEPDLDQIVLALLRTLDELSAQELPFPAEPKELAS